MKHVVAAAEHVGIELTGPQLDRFDRYRTWLGDEGVRAGGIGPAETPRIESRHLADSVLFATAMPEKPGDVIDLGTGVGLPGVPLAITLPDTRFTLIDRSQRRIDLLRRVLRILEVENCEVIRAEIETLDTKSEVVVTRASLPPTRLGEVIPGLLQPSGVAIAGGSWQTRPEHTGWETLEIPRHVLDRPIWLLMMRRE